MPQIPPVPTKKPDYLIEGITLSFHHAFQALKDGYAIRRAHWLDYWVKDPSDPENVLMKLHDGRTVSMKTGCYGMFALANVIANDWIVLTDTDRLWLDTIADAKCLVPGEKAGKPEEQKPVQKTPADYGLPIPPRGWKLRFSERTPELFQLVFDQEKSQPFSVAEATMWADFYDCIYSGKLSSDPLTYGFSRTGVTKDEPASTESGHAESQPETPAADAADTVSPDNPFGDTKDELASASVTTTPLPPGTTITVTNGNPDNKEAAEEPAKKTAADFPDPDPTGLPDGARITRNGNRVTVHLSDNFPRNLQRTQEIAGWAARYNLSLIDDKSMLGRMVFAFTEQ